MILVALRVSRPLFVLAPLTLLWGCAAPTATRTSTGQVGGAQLTAVYSRASKDYIRVQNADGSFPPETYVLKAGGNFGGPRYDVTMDTLSFEDVSRVIAPPLAAENYLPSDEPQAAKLLIVVYWGTTVVADDINPRDNRESVQLGERADRAVGLDYEGDPGARVGAARRRSDAAIDAHMEALQDSKADAQNANLLGYTDEVLRLHRDDPRLTTLQDEIQHDRYYVVLLAYDYRTAHKLGGRTLLWETRFSIPETGNDFGKAFPLMASIAGKYFGQDSHGLIHHNLANVGVEVGEPRALGVVPEK